MIYYRIYLLEKLFTEADENRLININNLTVSVKQTVVEGRQEQ